MNAVIQDFEQRVVEVEGYLRMLKAMDRSDAVIYVESKPSHKTVSIEDDWRKVAKATAYLLIYNIVESAIRSAFAYLYETIRDEGLSVRQVSVEVRNIWLDVEHKKISRESATPDSYKRRAAEMVLAALNEQVLSMSARDLPISGNLDARKIRELCQLHGVSHAVHAAAAGGVDLRTVKEQRNALAHGDKSFSECGREITVDDLGRIARQANVFVRSILRNMDKYVSNKRYGAPV